MSAIELSIVGGTKGLYTPPAASSFVFVLAQPPAPPPATISLASTWADEGRPENEGWLAFVTTTPTGVTGPQLETDLRGALQSARGIAWAVTGQPGFALVGQVPFALDVLDRPVVETDASIAPAAGLPPFAFAAGLRVVALRDDQHELAVLGFVEAGSSPGAALQVVVTGTYAGCVRFDALLASDVQGDTTVKPLASVGVDPLHPFDPDRTSITPLGPSYTLSGDPASGYSMTPAPS